MEDKGSTMIYEEPSTLFNENDWLDFRAQMQREVALHPDWPEAASALKGAENHLVWIKERALKDKGLHLQAA